MAKVINMTPHVINIVGGLSIPPSGMVARCTSTRVQVGTIDIDGVTIGINRTTFGNVTVVSNDGSVGMFPDQVDGVVFIVSAIVAQAMVGRKDVFIVDDTVRDDSGRIVGCKAVAQV